MGDPFKTKDRPPVYDPFTRRCFEALDLLLFRREDFPKF
jgi:hypothetical protein